ncbi:cobalamin biosynthesis protein CobD [Mycobacteroides abscessus subsp. abscessus]|nr:cobalamin biosynthesis protein CobD [Mycobacteroides abscessus subsp. abscessus]
MYPHGVEERPALGDGHPPEVADLYSTTHLSRRVQLGALASSALIAYVLGAVRQRRLLSRRSAG